jgi:hypothetical protein
MKDLKATITIPGSDPQDPQFDAFINYVATRAPTINEPDVYNGYPFLPLWWQYATSGDSWATYTTDSFWLCANNTAGSQVWWKMVFDANILSVLNAKGWELNTSRGYAARSSPAFSTAYTPSATNDTQVVVNCQTTSGAGGTATVTIQVDSGSGFVTLSTQGISGVSATSYPALSFIVPANAQYKIVDSVSGVGSSATINSINELTL